MKHNPIWSKNIFFNTDHTGINSAEQNVLEVYMEISLNHWTQIGKFSGNL